MPIPVSTNATPEAERTIKQWQQAGGNGGE
jgi:hypothetical protein